MGAGGAGGAGSGGAPQATGGAGIAAGSGGNAGSAATSASGGAAQAGAAGSAGGGTGGKELFILFGQSNMSGLSPMPTEPWPINDRVTFMVQFDCARLEQKKDEWLPAEPPLHGCQWATNGLGLGLGDYFGAALAEAWPDAEIGLIPNAIPGVTIDIFVRDSRTATPARTRSWWIASKKPKSSGAFERFFFTRASPIGTRAWPIPGSAKLRRW
jgi:hypothetical protein